MSFYRYPKTRNEMRAAAVAEVDPDLAEYGVKVRPKRQAHNLPNSYWDQPISDLSPSWKRHRKTQHRRVPTKHLAPVELAHFLEVFA